MADEPKPEGQEPEGTETTPETTPETPNPASETPQDEEWDKERAKATIQKLRGFEKQAKDQAKRLAEFEKAKQEADDARLSEQERLTKRVTELEQERERERAAARDRDNQHAVERAAAKIGIVDPEAAVKLLDWSEIEYDDQGRPQDVEGALNRLIEARPYLKAQQNTRGTANTSATNPATRQQAPGQRRYTSEQLRDYAFYKSNEADIQLAYAQGRVDP